MNREDYIKEGVRQLENNQHYETLDEVPTKQNNEETNQILEQASNINIIDGKTLKNLKTNFLELQISTCSLKYTRRTHQKDQ